MPVANQYDAGDQVIVSTYFWPLTAPVIGGFLQAKSDNTGYQLADPTTVTLTYRINQGAPTTLTYGVGGIVKDGVGLYHAILDTTLLPGLWVYRWQGTGAVIAPRANSFNVRPLPV
jgi:hypothetical protein